MPELFFKHPSAFSLVSAVEKNHLWLQAVP